MHVYFIKKPIRKYTRYNLFFDIFMTLITSGFWLIWVAVREASIRR